MPKNRWSFEWGCESADCASSEGYRFVNSEGGPGVHPFHVMAIELGQLAANAKTLRSIAKGLGVAPLDLLNHDTENDDLGHLVELMRKQPDCVRRIMLKVRPLVEN